MKGKARTYVWRWERAGRPSKGERGEDWREKRSPGPQGCRPPRGARLPPPPPFPRHILRTDCVQRGSCVTHLISAPLDPLRALLLAVRLSQTEKPKSGEVNPVTPEQSSQVQDQAATPACMPGNPWEGIRTPGQQGLWGLVCLSHQAESLCVSVTPCTALARTRCLESIVNNAPSTLRGPCPHHPTWWQALLLPPGLTPGADPEAPERGSCDSPDNR